MTQDQGLGFWGHVAVEVTCERDSNHTFFLPYSKTINTDLVYCPICERYFSQYKGEYDLGYLYLYKRKFDMVLDELSPSKREELYAMLDGWPETIQANSTPPSKARRRAG